MVVDKSIKFLPVWANEQLGLPMVGLDFRSFKS